MKDLNHKKRLLFFSIIAGGAVILSYIAVILIRQLAEGSPLCPDGLVPGRSLTCTYIGIVLPQYLTMAGIALLMYVVFRKYFNYSFLVSFFTVGYASYLSSAIGWLYSPLDVVNSFWIFYVLLFLLGGSLFFLLYLFFVKLKMWLWLKLLLAVVILFPVLPLAILYIERDLFAAFYTR